MNEDTLGPTAVLSTLLPGEQLIAVDPGDLTGVAWLGDGDFQFWSFSYRDWLYWLAVMTLPAESTLVCEQFVTRPAVFARTQIAGKVCGTLDYWCLHHRVKLVYQSPQTIKTMLPPAPQLRKAGWRWDTPHELDALRHAIYYLLTR